MWIIEFKSYAKGTNILNYPNYSLLSLITRNDSLVMYSPDSLVFSLDFTNVISDFGMA